MIFDQPTPDFTIANLSVLAHAGGSTHWLYRYAGSSDWIDPEYFTDAEDVKAGDLITVVGKGAGIECNATIYVVARVRRVVERPWQTIIRPLSPSRVGL